jgi:hypothetical protein
MYCPIEPMILKYKHVIIRVPKSLGNLVFHVANTTIDCSQKIAEATVSPQLPSNPYPMTQSKH